MLSEEDLNSRVGYQLPGGEYLLEPYKNWLTNDVVGAPNDSSELAHPMFCYYAALTTMGISLEELSPSLILVQMMALCLVKLRLISGGH